MVTSFISRFGFSIFKLKWKTKNKLQIWILMSSYFEKRKTISFYVLCLNFSIKTKMKTIFLITHFNLSRKKKWNGTLGTWESLQFLWEEQMNNAIIKKNMIVCENSFLCCFYRVFYFRIALINVLQICFINRFAITKFA